MNNDSTGKDEVSVIELVLSTMIICLCPFRNAENKYD